jgi:hypothetical protein
MVAPLESLAGVRAAVLVEGTSDEVAIQTLAVRRGVGLDALGVRVLAMGGATEVRRYVSALVTPGSATRLAGLCDEGEEGYFRRALEHVGHDGTGFFVCHTDLEDELIRALGPERVVEVIEAQGELRSWLRFCKQPAQRGRTVQDRLHRFMGTRSGRKAQYAAALVAALPLDAVPTPLDALLDHLAG